MTAPIAAVTATSIGGPSAGDALEPSEALARARDGDIVRLRGAGTATGLQPIARTAVLDAIAQVASSARASEVSDAGVEQAHRYLDPHELHDTFRAAERILAPRAIELADRVLALAAVPTPRRVYVCSRVWVRLHVPLSALDASADVRDRPYVVGHLTPAPPHRDGALSHPRSTLSAWLAVGRVRSGNSMHLWPDDRDTKDRASLDELDRDGALTPELEAGDLLLFDADHLHATVPNHTDETRVAITVRVVAGRLRFGPGPHWRPYYDRRLVGTPLEPLASLRSRLTLACLRRALADRRRR